MKNNHIKEKKNKIFERNTRKIDRILYSPALTQKEKIDKIKEIDKILLSFKSFLLPQENNKIKNTKKYKTKKIYKPLFGQLQSLIRDYPKISKLGKENNIITVKYIPPQIKLEYENIKASLEYINKIVGAVIKPVQYITQNGFLTLNKEEYNIIYEFHSLLKKYSSSDIMNHNIKNITILKNKLARIIQKKYYITLLENAFEKALRNTKYQGDTDFIITLIRKIILSSDTGTSLKDILISIQIKQNKGFIDEKDFIYMANPRPINTKLFKTNKKIADKIKKYTKKIKINIDLKENELLYLLFVKDRITQKKILALNKTNTQYKLYNLTKIILREYFHKFEEITSKPIPIITKDDRITIEKVFPLRIEKSFVEINQIYRLINDMIINNVLEREMTLKYSYEDFENYIGGECHSNKLFRLIENLSNIFYQISKKLFESFLLEEKLKKMTRKQKIKIISNPSFPEISIPYHNKKITLNCPLINKTVKEVYEEIIDFSANFAFFYQNKELTEKLNSIEYTKKYLNNLKENLKRCS